MKHFVILLLLFSSQQLLFAQGEFTPSGENAIGFQLSLGRSEQTNIISPGAAFSFSGVLDLGATFSLINPPGDNTSGKAISLGLAIHPIKASKETHPFTLSALLQYQNTAYSAYQSSFSVSSWAYGPALHVRASLSQSVYAQPAVSLLFVEVPKQSSTYRATSTRVVGISLPVVFERGSNKNYLIGGSVGMSSEVTSYGITVGFVGPLQQ